MQRTVSTLLRAASLNPVRISPVPQRTFFSFFKSKTQKFSENFEQGEAALKAGQYAVAAEKLESSLKYDDPSNSKADQIIRSMAVAYGQMNNIDKSVECYMKLQQRNPDDQNIQLAIGLIYGKSQNPEKAMSIFEEALSKNASNLELTNQVALYCEQLGLYTKAIELYERCIKLDPKNAKSFTRIGYIYVRNLKDQQKGLEFMLQAEKLDSQNIDLVFNIGMCYYRMKKFTEALAYLNNCLIINPEFHDAKRSIKHIQSLKL